MFVITFDWSTFLSRGFKKVKGIKEMQHFSFSADRPGVVLMKKEWEGPTTELVLKQEDLPVGMLERIQPAGLTRDRQATSGRLSTRTRGTLFVRNRLPSDPSSPSPSSRSSSSSHSDTSSAPVVKRAVIEGRREGRNKPADEARSRKPRRGSWKPRSLKPRSRKPW